MNAVEARGLTRHFGSVPAVDGLDLTVRPGEMLGLVGPDGAGKTTTIRLLTGILAPTAGTASVLGLDLVQQVTAVRRAVGYLSQQFSLYGDLTVDENVEFCARIHDVTDFAARRQQLLEFTRLAPFRRRLAAQLSGGMKQKLALACTLVHRPSLVFLDEPTTGVDPVSRRDLWVILADLLRQGITLVLTTPYLDEAERCTRVALLHRGRVVRLGEPAAIAASLGGAHLEVRSPAARQTYAALRRAGLGPAAHMVGERIRLRADDEAAGRRAVAAALAAAGLPAAPVRVVTPSLEDAFIELVQDLDQEADSPAA